MVDKKMTAVASSVGADERQSTSKNLIDIIPNSMGKGNLQVVKTLENGGFKDLATKTLTELYDTVYPQKKSIVDGLLYSGVYLFVGAPKVGKSFFMAQLGYHISSGIPLWGREVHQGQVLYLALEDDYSRLQHRLSTMFGTDSNDNFHLATGSKTLETCLEVQLERFMEEHDDVKLIIIDTLQKIRDVGGEKFSYANDYNIVARLKDFCDNHEMCMIVVHHTRKMESSDSFEMISGTNGLLGAADGAIVMHKDKRTENKEVLDMVGRDQQDMRIHLEFDREKFQWELTDMETELWIEPPDPILDAIANVLTEEQPLWQGTATELLEILPECELKPNKLTRKLNVNVGRLQDEYNIHYESSRSHDGRIIKLSYEK